MDHAHLHSNKRSFSDDPSTNTTKLTLVRGIQHGSNSNATYLLYNQEWSGKSIKQHPSDKIDRIVISIWPQETDHDKCGQVRSWLTNPEMSEIGMPGILVKIVWKNASSSPRSLSESDRQLVCKWINFPDCASQIMWKKGISAKNVMKRARNAHLESLYYFEYPSSTTFEQQQYGPSRNYRRFAKEPLPYVAPKDLDVANRLNQITMSKVHECSTIVKWSKNSGLKGVCDGFVHVPPNFSTGQFERLLDEAEHVGASGSLLSHEYSPHLIFQEPTSKPALAVKINNPSSMHVLADISVAAMAPACKAGLGKWHIDWVLPADMFVDPYEIKRQFADHNLWKSGILTRPHWELFNGQIELEEHVGANTALSSLISLKWPAHSEISKYHLQVPFHARYRVPRRPLNNQDPMIDTVTLLPPVLSFECSNHTQKWPGSILAHSAIAVGSMDLDMISVPVANFRYHTSYGIWTGAIVLMGFTFILSAVSSYVMSFKVKRLEATTLKKKVR